MRRSGPTIDLISGAGVWGAAISGEGIASGSSVSA
jgi:hypothetical protein